MSFLLSKCDNKYISKLLTDLPIAKKKKGKKTIEYINAPCAFDIETSSFYLDDEKTALMYIYVLGINGKVKLGRTWKEFLSDINEIIKYYNLSLDKRMIIYVHNLSYEFQFIQHLFNWEKVFAIDERTPVYALTKEGIEFRCSYILSNYSLDRLGKNLIKYKVEKMVGDLDYSLIRTPITPMSDKELGYVINDALVVMAYIQESIEQYDSIVRLPLTNTGFIRNLCKNNCIVGKGAWKYRSLIKNLTLDADTFKALRKAFQGGFTHANSFNVGNVMYNVFSKDLTSSYPTVLCAEKFPMSKCEHIEKIDDLKTFEFLLNKFNCLFKITFYNIEETFIYENYIGYSKCIECDDYKINNGRISKAKKLSMYITELDYDIIQKTYKWDKMEISDFRIFIKKYLPKEFVHTILDLYQNKTSLKDVAGQEVEYMRSKNQINSCYGMTVTNPCRDEIDYIAGWVTNKCDVDDQLEQYNSSRSRFLYYAWGIWTTAYARHNLWEGILEVAEDYIYSDTDSIKGINLEKHQKFFKQYNEKIQRKLKKSLEYHGIDLSYIKPKTKEGIEKPLGVFDDDGFYKMFKTLGAKRYMYVDNKDELHITIAGVNKATGVEYLKHKYITFDNIFKNFDLDLQFPKEYTYFDEVLHKEVTKKGSGKNTHTYIDIPRSGIVTDYLGNEYEFYERSAVHIEPSAYSLSLSQEFLDFLLDRKENFIYYEKE